MKATLIFLLIALPAVSLAAGYTTTEKPPGEYWESYRWEDLWRYPLYQRETNSGISHIPPVGFNLTPQVAILPLPPVPKVQPVVFRCFTIAEGNSNCWLGRHSRKPFWGILKDRVPFQIETQMEI